MAEKEDNPTMAQGSRENVRGSDGGKSYTLLARLRVSETTSTGGPTAAGAETSH